MLLESPQSFNLAERLRELATTRPHDTALVCVDDLGDTRYDYRALDARAQAIGHFLAARNAAGERALLLMDSGIDYVAAFFGCLYAGTIAVPAYPPESAREQHLARLRGIAADCDAHFVLTTASLIASTRESFGAIAPNAALVAVDEVAQHASADVPFSSTHGADDIAFLQYTSGSTSSPKGVMVTHGNVLANEIAIQSGLGVTPDDVFVSWLPLYHDMGLIGTLLQPVYSGIPLILMSPRYFLERPVRWLEAIARHRGTISGGPDFAYRLCCERVRDTQIADLDLSSWRVAFCGSEPVRFDTQEAFAERFAAARFDSDARYPCYGLAEATLFVTGGTRGDGPSAVSFADSGLKAGRAEVVALQAAQEAQADADSECGAKGVVTLVGCGREAVNHEVRIVAPDSGVTLDDGRVGEIWVAGPSVARGYWRRDDASAESFPMLGATRWLRTGDLGFRHGGEIFIVGRRKDMIIVRGQNLYPQDLERAVEMNVDAVRKGRIAAFGVELKGREGIGLAVEISRSMQKLATPQVLVDALNDAIGEACGEPLSVVVLLNPGGLPKTSSGKLQRSAAAQKWRSRELDAYAVYEHGSFVNTAHSETGAPDRAAANPASTDDTLREGVERELAAIWHDVLGVPVETRSAHFFSLGGNSLAATQLAAQVRDRWQVAFEIADVFGAAALHESAALIERLCASGARIAPMRIDFDPQAGERVPASFAQRRQWFLWQLDRASSAYHLAGGLTLRGALNIDALRAALQALVYRHETLRTTFETSADGVPLQVIHPSMTIVLDQVDLRVSIDGNDEVDANEASRAIVAQPFDLTRGPLLRATLLRTGAAAWRLLLVAHHIAADGWSADLLFDEIAHGYRQAILGDREALAPLPKLPVRYRDYAAWQHRWVGRDEHARQLAYWRAQLADMAPASALPADAPRGNATNHPAAAHRFTLSALRHAALKSVAREHGTTFFTVSLTALLIALHRYTGDIDPRVGVPVANRDRREIAGLVGFFVNTQVMRGRLERGMTLRALLIQMRDTMFGAQAHQDLPFDLLVDALQPERSAGRTPFFDVMAGHQTQRDTLAHTLPELAASRFRLDDAGVPFELTLDTYETADGGVDGVFTYASDLFDAWTVAQFADFYGDVLSALIGVAGSTIDAVCGATHNETAALVALAGPAAQPERIEPVIAAIERQAARQPLNPAVIAGELEISAGELNARANRLAYRLIKAGVGAEVKVGIGVGRSVEMVVAVLAVLKAGAAYVPLDPSYPATRLVYMVADSGIEWLITHEATRALFADTLGEAASRVGVIELDASDASKALDVGAVSNLPESNPQVAADPDSLAYVIYTSGSTGQPKGVAIDQRSLAIHTQATIDFCALNENDRVLQFAAFSFDGFIEEIFPALCVGAAIVLRDVELWDSGTFYRKLLQHRISVIDVTTAYWHLLAQDFAKEGARDYGALRLAIAGGEAMAIEGVNAWRAAGLQHVKLLNTYGPTETTVSATLFDCDAMVANADDTLRKVPIGRALAGRRMYVLDGCGELAPRGVAGELYIGGEALARGYLNRAALTAERFVPDPFSTQGGRLYRTGDLVRWRADGALEYLGRIDHQVKIRGFRIELGEVEAQLLAQDNVREAVVTAQGATGGMRLVGYVAPHAGATLDGTSLRAALSVTLPDYMVPAAVMVLDALPLTPNGKVDRKALPAPEFQTRGYEAPQGELETTLATLFEQVLEVE
ncbi:amino acid adenylation domain-containing protein, partial [Paraburkholderia fungorum]|uniref:amino acid adenylation domain-containing protein n=1 Tax=Paraburkholderia fungorum TaxID=134537 RepID=UPI0038B80EC5